jgi:hypothetical protein
MKEIFENINQRLEIPLKIDPKANPMTSLSVANVKD